MHEFADTGRPITAAFAGGPGTPSPFRRPAGAQLARSRLLGQANIAAATQLYLRYDGEIGTGTDNHALNLGVRFSW